MLLLSTVTVMHALLGVFSGCKAYQTSLLSTLFQHTRTVLDSY